MSSYVKKDYEQPLPIALSYVGVTWVSLQHMTWQHVIVRRHNVDM